MTPYSIGYMTLKRQRRNQNIKIAALLTLGTLAIIFSTFQPSPVTFEHERARCDAIKSDYGIASTYDPATRECVTASPVYLLHD